MLRYVRRLSTSRLAQLTPEELKALPVGERVSLIDELNHAEHPEKQKALQALIPDFSVFFKLPKESIKSPEVLQRLIEVNPGRVVTPWELYQSHQGKFDDTPDLKAALVAKLVGSDVMENLGYLLQVIKSGGLNANTEQLIVSSLEQHQLVSVIAQLIADGHLSPQFGHELLERTKDEEFLAVFDAVFTKNPEIFKERQLSDALDAIERVACGGVSEEYLKVAQEVDLQIPIEFIGLGQRIVDYIVEKGLDVSENPESLLLRMRIITFFGITVDDMSKANERWHRYQRESYGREIVQTELVKAFCFQAFTKQSQLDLQIAETLVPADDLSVRILQFLIVAKSAFNAEDSLAVYNDYIGQVSREANPETHRSASGKLTESLVLAQLYDHDREFAHLVYDKAIEAGVISDEYEVAHIKKLFRVYGDAFDGNENWAEAKPKLAEYVKKYLRQL
ncbi:hypothetical protein DIURU_001112 [Diutina rugosa]|uniref:Uncharacterized protein n=1 Tax=Diutina rugosa TaxID=5481 RepID=A0A642UVZ2_DIURU|nr:uncharacterized protein DIURU_001112 [Diutina rugosa]KAA8906374.1 hypothetical protein DIURU_001112 [Diutina rugosa]